MPAPLDLTLPSPLEIRISRRFDAPPSLVFDCHTVPALVQRWMLGPPGWTLSIRALDVRAGGRFDYHWTAEDGSGAFGIQGAFVEVDAPRLLVHTEEMEGFDGVSVETTQFTADGTGTAYVTTLRYATQEARDAALASGMADGMAASYDWLDDVMAQAAG